MRILILIAVLLAALPASPANPTWFELADEQEFPAEEAPVEPEPVEVIVEEPVPVRTFADFSVYYVREGNHSRRVICERPPTLPWAATSTE